VSGRSGATTRTQKEIFGNKDEQVSDYNITVTDAGTDNASSCSVTVRDEVGRFRCSLLLEDFIVNVKALRFLLIYPVGYVDGLDTNANTPAISGGTCTKID
jgi:hypothetical protein